MVTRSFAGCGELVRVPLLCEQCEISGFGRTLLTEQWHTTPYCPLPVDSGVKVHWCPHAEVGKHMVLSNSELERIADEMYKGRIIAHSVYCGNCGYNLRTLPYLYTCPECGKEYNARPRKMIGIFLPQNAELPVRDMFSTILCGLFVYLFGRDALQQKDPFWIFVTGVLLVLGCWFARHVYTRTMHLIKTIGITRRIAANEQTEDSQ